MVKINILFVMSQRMTALEYWRQWIPHNHLASAYTDDFNVRFTYNLEDEKEEEIKSSNIVCFLRTVSLNHKTKETIDKLHSYGCKVLLDIDDYWDLPKSHNLYNSHKKTDLAKQTIDALTGVDWVTTTTAYFADIISQYNKNVTVLPNCIWEEDKQFVSKPIENTRMRFGWIGGVHHTPDIEMIRPNFDRLAKFGEDVSKIQICLGGFNTNRMENGQIRDLKAKKDWRVKTEDKEGVAADFLPEYIKIEEMLTSNYKLCSPNYTDYLKQHTPAMEHISFDQPYRRLWAKDIYHYGELYNEIDVALVPLIANRFNACKSELKIIEAGWMKKAVICSDVLPYSPFLDEDNSLLIKPSRNAIDWYINIKYLSKNPSLVKEMGEALHEMVKENFDLNKHNETRKDLYKRLCQ